MNYKKLYEMTKEKGQVICSFKKKIVNKFVFTPFSQAWLKPLVAHLKSIFHDIYLKNRYICIFHIFEKYILENRKLNYPITLVNGIHCLPLTLLALKITKYNHVNVKEKISVLTEFHAK